MGNALSAHVWTYSKRIFGTPEVGREVRFRTKDGLLDEQYTGHNRRAQPSGRRLSALRMATKVESNTRQ